ncbi:asparagine synthase (glutamine-hydrolyzing) [Chryseolinea sp. T2]|uniref:asparagine synthase (glutamine-hydrolyzing) n=1 Tax=Chryseolinea sp. T2 TaxID=3129255 RepID=UPI003077B735
MCGIAGYYNAEVPRTIIRDLTTCLVHRGPDANGSYVHNNVGLIHTRLAIIELSELGSQPYRFEHLALVFNGEIYNFKDVRKELQSEGYSFVSNSDTEVVIKAFHRWGSGAPNRFIGMFAFAIYDRIKNELFLCRDRLGVKPLYYSTSAKGFYFGSEPRAIVLMQGNAEVNVEAAALYFRFGYVPSPYSAFDGVHKLEPGTFMRIGSEGAVLQRYWSWSSKMSAGISEDVVLGTIEELLVSSAKFRMVSDVPVGLFLSGGVDSSLLASILKQHVGGGLQSFTIGFSEPRFDESMAARNISNHLGFRHVEKILELDEAKKFLYKFYDIYDEPFADTSGIPVACVSELAKETGVKVVLSADGGDELFAGYNHYMDAYRLYKRFSRMPRSVRRTLVSVSRRLVSAERRKQIVALNFEHKLSAVEELLSAGNYLEFYEAFIANQSKPEVLQLLKGTIVPDLPSNHERDEMLANMSDWDISYYLPDDLLVKIDRASMFFGIEAREPFLDHRLVEYAVGLPATLKVKNGISKYLLKSLLGKYLPEHLIQQKKRGFSIPIFAWFSRDLDEMFENYLSDDSLKRLSYINSKEVKGELTKYKYYKQRGKEYNIEKMWRILSFVMWHKTWIEKVN